MMGLISIYKLDSDIKLIVDSRILKVLIKVDVNDVEEIIIKVSAIELRNIDGDTNSININKLVIISNFMKKCKIKLVLVILIATSRFIIDRRF